MVNGKSPSSSNEKKFDFTGVKPPKKRKEIVQAETRNEEGLIMWKSLWENPHIEQDWLVEPILPKGREIATYCAAGIGKSEVALFVSAKIAMGEAVLDRPDGKPLRVVYLDYEMTENDLRGRLLEMGLGPESDLRRLFYYLHPPFPPFDTPSGGAAILDIVERHKADLLIIDTTSRVVTGDESSADTYRDFHQHSGRKLKEMGITVWRLDHAGKNAAAGQRGSSAKNDDVDVIWFLQRVTGGMRLTAEKRRQSWVPEEVSLQRGENPVRYEFSRDHVRDSVIKLAAALRKHKVPRDASVRAAREMLKKAGIPAGQENLISALKLRNSRRNAAK